MNRCGTFNSKWNQQWRLRLSIWIQGRWVQNRCLTRATKLILIVPFSGWIMNGTHHMNKSSLIMLIKSHDKGYILPTAVQAFNHQRGSYVEGIKEWKLTWKNLFWPRCEVTISLWIWKKQFFTYCALIKLSIRYIDIWETSSNGHVTLVKNLSRIRQFFDLHRYPEHKKYRFSQAGTVYNSFTFVYSNGTRFAEAYLKDLFLHRIFQFSARSN